MAWQLVQETKLSDPVNGFVTDAAHNYWKASDALLIITSVYSQLLHRWIPTLFSYANGGTAEHYQLHFHTLFQSLHEQCTRRDLPITDEMFATVMDFSVAQSNGFIAAFIQFWEHVPNNNRSTQELQLAANTLIKGCEQHFRTGVTRLKKISGIVKPTLADAFEKRALALLDASDIADFNQRASLLTREFPSVLPWLQWWRQKGPAQKLFKAFRIMDDQTWSQLPATTNAEEALHFSLYRATAKGVGLIEGIEGLHHYAEWFMYQSTASSIGIPTLYGQPERWKIIAKEHGRTKLFRNRKKAIPNDGQPPDTAKVLMTGKPASTIHSLPGYTWQNNSCWLDTALELLYRAIFPIYREFQEVLSMADTTMTIGTLYYTLGERYSLDMDQSINTNLLSLKRDHFWEFLQKKGLLVGTSAPESLFGWLDGALREYRAKNNTLALFETCVLEIWTCLTENSTQCHSRIPDQARRISTRNITLGMHHTFQGSLQKWFQHTISSPVVEKHIGCWKNSGDKSSCIGSATLTTVWLSLPVILIIEFDGTEGKIPDWEIPKVLRGTSEYREIQYHLMGKGHFAQLSSHYTASFRFKQYIYEYDGLKNLGNSIRINKGSLATHGQDYTMSNVNAVVYTLENSVHTQEHYRKIKTEWLRQHHHLIPDPLQGSWMKFIPEDSFGFILSTSERNWMANPYDKTWIDYTWQRTIPIPTPKKTRFDRTVQWKTISPIGTNASDTSFPTFNAISGKFRQNLQTIEKDREEELASSNPSQKSNLRSENSIDSLANASILSDFPINCRCGFQGDGNSPDIEDEGCIQCWTCKQWSHIACQYDGQASNLPPKARFTCHDCDVSKFQNILQPRSYRKENQAFIELSKQPLQQRLV